METENEYKILEWVSQQIRLGLEGPNKDGLEGALELLDSLMIDIEKAKKRKPYLMKRKDEDFSNRS